MSEKAKRSTDPGAVWGSHALRRTVVAVSGAAAAGLLGMAFAETVALKPIQPVGEPHVLATTVIDGPPTDVEPAPAPVRPQRRHARAAGEDDVDPATDAELAAIMGPPPGAAPSGPGGSEDSGAAQHGGGCAQLPSPADQLVCANPGLAAADAAEEGLYRNALSDSDQPGAMQAEQRSWRAARDRAAAAGGPDGLAEIYDARIHELRGPPGG